MEKYGEEEEGEVKRKRKGGKVKEKDIDKKRGSEKAEKQRFNFILEQLNTYLPHS